MSGFPSADVIFKDGYDKIINLLAKNLQIQTNSIVKSVYYNSTDNITVSTTSKNYECDYVICSVPLGVLKFNSIEFNPALPRYKLDSIENVGFGTVTKLALKFKDQFWDSDVQYYYTVAKETGRWPVWMNYRTFSKEKILMGLCMGDYAKKADLMSKEELIEDGLKVLKNVWGYSAEVTTRTVDTHVKRLREKLGPIGKYVHTIRGVGYKFARSPD